MWRAPEGPEGPAAAPVDNGARPRYPQTTGAPSPSKFRMQFPHDTDRHTLKNRRISTIRLQHLKYTQGNCMRNYRGAVRTQYHATTRPNWCGGRRRVWRAWLRCSWAVVGPGGASRRRAEPKACGAAGSRAGRRPRARQAARPSEQPGPASSPAQRAARPGGQLGPTRQRVERSAKAEWSGGTCLELTSSWAIRQQEPPTHRNLMDAE